MTTQSYAMRIAVDGGDSEVVVKRIENALVEAGAKGSIAFEKSSSSHERQMAQLKRLADALRSELDPLHGAQMRLNADMERYAMLAEKGAITTEELAKAQRLARQKFNDLADTKSRPFTAEEDSRAAALRVMIERREADLNPLAAAQNRLNKELAEYKALAASGAVSTEELAKAQLIAKERFEETSRAIAREKGLLKDEPEVVSSRQKRFAQLNLARQGADVFTTAAMGMSPGMIAIQQGPQVLDALAMSGIKLTAAMGVAAVAVGVLGGAVLVLGGDAMRSAKDLRTFEAALSASADGADYQAAKLALQARGFDAMGASVEEARGMVKVFLNESLNPARLDEFGRTSLDMAKVLGVDVVQAAQKTSKAFTGTYADVKALDKELNFLTFTERNQIKAMFDSGKASDARNEAFRIFSEKYAKAYNESLTEADKLTRSLSGAWDSLVESLGNTALVEDATEKIGELIGKLGDWLDQYAKVKGMTDDGLAKEQERLLKSLYSEQGQKNYDARARSEIIMAQALPTALRPIIRPRTADELKAIDRARLNEITGQMASRQAPSVGDTLETDSERAQKEKQDADEAAAKKAASAVKAEANRAENLRRQAEAMRVNTAGTLDLARAYLVSDAAALEAEASMRGLTEQTRKGGDAGAQRAAIDRQVAAMIADTALAGAKSVVQMEKETAQIEFVSKAISEQGLSRVQAMEAAEKQSMLAQLNALRDKSEGKEKEVLTEVINRLSAAYDKLNGIRRSSQAQQVVEGNSEAIRMMQMELSLLGETAEARAIAIAQAQQKAELGYKPDQEVTNSDDAKAIASAGDRVAQDFALGRAQYADQARKDHADAVALMQAELELRGLNSRETSRMLALKQVELDLQRRGIDAASKEGQEILNNTRYQQDMLDVILRQRDAQKQAEEVQTSLFDELRSNIRAGKMEADDFGDALVSALRRAAQEAIILATINPLQNWLTGSNEATDVGGFLSNLFGRGKSGGSSSSSGASTGSSLMPGEHSWLDQFLGTAKNPFSWASSVFRFASGVESAPGGMTEIAEDGFEIVYGRQMRNLAPGTTVKNHNATRDIIRDIASQAVPAAAVAAPPQYFTFDLRGAVVTEDLLQQMNSIAENKAAEVTQIGLNEYDRTLPDRIEQYQSDPRGRR